MRRWPGILYAIGGAAARGLPPALRAALASAPAAVAAVAACAAGFATPGALSLCLPGAPAAPAPAGVAASFLIHLALLALALMLLPLHGRLTPGAARPSGWPFLGAWLRTALCTAAAFAGWRGSPWSGGTWDQAAALAALAAAQAAAVCGLGAALSWLACGFPRAARVALAAFVALLFSALLWTRPPLLAFYRSSPRAAESATRAVVALSPPFALAAAWNETGAPFDLTKRALTYRVWLGSYQIVPYPPLWPRYETAIEATPDAGGARATRRLEFGLALSYLLWGLGLLAASDLVGWGLCHVAQVSRRSGSAPG